MAQSGPLGFRQWRVRGRRAPDGSRPPTHDPRWSRGGLLGNAALWGVAAGRLAFGRAGGDGLDQVPYRAERRRVERIADPGIIDRALYKTRILEDPQVFPDSRLR